MSFKIIRFTREIMIIVVGALWFLFSFLLIIPQKLDDSVGYIHQEQIFYFEILQFMGDKLQPV